MKRVTLLTLLLMNIPLAHASTYCEGYRAGFEVGFKQETGRKPPRPYCPSKPHKYANDPKDDYEFGYLNGLESGREKGSK